jgi:hypothetical protein
MTETLQVSIGKRCHIHRARPWISVFAHRGRINLAEARQRQAHKICEGLTAIVQGLLNIRVLAVVALEVVKVE